jgi:hypothetical protein
MLPRSPVGSSRGTPSHNLAALPFSLIHFGSAANMKLVALPKKSCFLAAVVKNGGGAEVFGQTCRYPRQPPESLD